MESTSKDWRDKANCLGTDPELFFPTGETSAADRDQIERAKAFCVDCLVRNQCLEYALDTKQDDGVWGETTKSERAKIKRIASRERRGWPTPNQN